MGRMMRAFAFVATLSALPVAVAGQDTPGVEQRGRGAISLGWAGGGNLGLWLRVSERADVGLEGGYARTDDDDVESWVASVRPALKAYLGASGGPVYWVVGLRLSWGRSQTDLAGTSTNRALGGFTGVGLDWFPAGRVSVGGHVGIDVAATRRTREGVGLPGVSDVESSGYDLGTLSSGIRLQLYF
jgi:hypothetical protein